MARHTLPGTRLHVSPLCLGSADLGTKIKEDAAFALLDAFAERGGNFVDSAHCYAFWIPGCHGLPEQLIGRYLKRRGREGWVVATKGGHVGMPPGLPRPDAFLSPEAVSQDLTESLDRLQMATVDLYYLHRDDPRVPAVELIDAANEHISSGRARAIGASNWPLDRLLEANRYAHAKGLTPFCAIQNQWSLAQPDWTNEGIGTTRYHVSAEVAALALEDVAVIPYSPNANGFFASNGAKASDSYPGGMNRARLAAVQALSKEKGASPGAIALAYLMSHPGHVIPITGTCSLDHLDEAFRAVELRLSPEELRRLEAGA